MNSHVYEKLLMLARNINLDSLSDRAQVCQYMILTNQLASQGTKPIASPERT